MPAKENWFLFLPHGVLLRKSALINAKIQQVRVDPCRRRQITIAISATGVRAAANQLHVVAA